MILDEVYRKIKEKHFWDMAGRAIVLKVQNIADYYFTGSSRELWEHSDFPTVAPPWKVIWTEWVWSGATVSDDLSGLSEEQLESAIVTRRADGTYSLTPKNFPPEVSKIGALFHYKEIDDEEVRWLLFASLYMPKLRGNPFVMESVFFVSPEGRWLNPVVGTPVADRMIKECARLGCVGGNGRYLQPVFKNMEHEQLINIMHPSTCFDVPMLAICFCHCKNVEALPSLIPEKSIKKRLKSGNAPISKFYTLKIDQMRQALNVEAPGETLQNALHICRGHFKDYRDGKGLFGRIQGLYWWDQHVRGDLSAGEVRKDYSVRI